METNKFQTLGIFYIPHFFLQVLKDMARVKGRPGESLEAFDFAAVEKSLREEHGNNIREHDVMSAALYPKVTADFLNFRDQYGPVDKLDTRIFLSGPKVGEEFDVRKVQLRVLEQDS